MNVGKIFNNLYVKNLLAAALILMVLVFITLKWLDKYTRHGMSIEVPAVRGMLVGAADPLFTNSNLKYEVIDSVFNRTAAPGTIVETIPPIGTKVKEGRTIYITINSFTSQLLAVPEVIDFSQRQAFAMLRSIGFENISTRLVSGVYRDLVLGLETSSGQEVRAGDRVPVGTALTLLVSSGEQEILFPEDSVIIENSPEEAWF